MYMDNNSDGHVQLIWLWSFSRPTILDWSSLTRIISCRLNSPYMIISWSKSSNPGLPIGKNPVTTPTVHDFCGNSTTFPLLQAHTVNLNDLSVRRSVLPAKEVTESLNIVTVLPTIFICLRTRALAFLSIMDVRPFPAARARSREPREDANTGSNPPNR